MSDESSQSTQAVSQIADLETAPLCIFVVGMAGSGKSSFVGKVCKHRNQKNLPVFTVNLDPAVLRLPYDVNIDIRESLNYYRVMQEFQLGPNGAIMTSLNLFATNFGPIVQIIDQNCRRESVDEERPLVLFDTAGQMESFTWSASGQIFCDMISARFPTLIVYITDIPRSSNNPMNFMTNMLYSCSIMLRTQLPIVILLNKNDIEDHDTIKSWIVGEDKFEQFEKAFKRNSDACEARFVDSFALALEFALVEFYDQLSVIGFDSSNTSTENFGYDQLMVALNKECEVFIKEFWPIRMARQNSEPNYKEFVSGVSHAEVPAALENDKSASEEELVNQETEDV